METYRTELTLEEVKALYVTMRELEETQCSEVVHLWDLEWTVKNLINMSRDHKIVKFYQGDKFCGILCFEYGTSWWTPEVTLSEVFVFAVKGFHGLQRYAIKELHKIAKEVNASIITSGCFFQKNPQIVTNGYKKFGFNETYPTYAKVVKNNE
mgnify:FL=1